MCKTNQCGNGDLNIAEVNCVREILCIFILARVFFNCLKTSYNKTFWFDIQTEQSVQMDLGDSPTSAA